MGLIFAWDAPGTNAVGEITSWMQTEPTASYWALVDVALLGAEKFKSAARRQHWSPINALANTTLEAFGDVAPHLVAINAEPRQRKTQVEQLLELTASAPALSWLHSAYPEHTLQKMFGYLGKAQVEERPRAIHLRFADTRTLPELLKILLPNQQKRVVDIVQDWRWFDRLGNWQKWEVGPTVVEETTVDSASHLNVSRAQFTHVLKTAEADIFFHRLAIEFPALLPPDLPGTFHQRLASILSIASELTLHTEPDRWLFLMLSLSYGDGFHRCEALTTTWDVVRETGADLREQMQRWSPEILTVLNEYKAKQ